MRSLRGFAAQAIAAYGKLNTVIGELVPVVGRLSEAWRGMRDALKDSIPHLDAANSSFARMRNVMALTVPVASALTNQMVALAGAARISGNVSASAFTSAAAAATRSAAATSASGAGMAALLGPLGAIAAVAGVAYVAMFKWDSVPLILKPILLLMSPLVLAIRAVATAWSVATLPMRIFTGSISLAISAITGLIKVAASLPGLLLKTGMAAASLGKSMAVGIASGARSALSAIQSFTRGALGFLSRLGTSIGAAGSQLKGIVSSLVDPVAESAVEFARAGTAAIAFAAATGLSEQSVTALGYAAERSGSSVESVASAVETVNAKLSEATAGSNEAARSFRQLGLDVNRLAAMSPEDRFTEIGIAIARLADPLDRAKAAQDAFGSSGAGLVGMFAKGAAGLAQMRMEAERLGLVMSVEQVAAAKELTAANKYLRDSLVGLWRTIGAAVAPQLAEAARQTAVVIKATTGWLAKNGPLVAQLFRIASTVATVGAGLATLGSVLAAATPGLIALTGAAVAGYAAWGRYGESLEAAFGSVFGFARNAYAETMRVMGGIWDALQGGDLEGAVEVAWAGALRAWTVGLTTLAELSNATFGGILNALASGEWRLAADQAWTAIQSVFTEGVSALDGVWTGLTNTIDGAITYLRQQINVAIKEIARFALAALDKANQVAKLVTRYDPTGKLDEMRQGMVLEVNASGLSRTARGSTDATNQRLQDESGARQWGRIADLGGRQAERDARMQQLDASASAAQEAARNAAAAKDAETRDRLDRAMGAAAAARDAAKRQSLTDEGKANQLRAGAQAAQGNGGGFGATFSASALMSLGTTAQERAAKAAEATVSRLDQIIAMGKQKAKEQKNNVLEFAP